MASVSAELTLEIAQFRAAIKQAENSIKGFASRSGQSGRGSGKDMGGGFLSGLNDSLKATAVGAALAGAAATIAGVMAAATKAITGSAELEQQEIAFEVILGGADEAKKMLSDLRAMGASTPFETADLIEATQTMLQFGISGDKVLPMLSRLGDIASGDAQKLKSLALIYGQVQSMGKLQGGDRLQFVNAKFNPLEVIAKQTGESMPDLIKRMEGGKVSADEVTQAIITATSAGGTFFEMSARQSATAAGKWSTMTDAFKEMLLEFGKPVTDAFKPLIGSISQLLTSMQGGAKAFGETLADAIQYATALLQTFNSGMEFWTFVGQSFTLWIKDALNTLSNGLASIFGQEFKLFDTEELTADLSTAAAKFYANLAKVREQIKTQSQDATGGGGVGGAAGKGEKTGSPVGGLASAINLIMGRSANEMILSEAQQQTAEQRKMNETMKQVNENIKRLAPAGGNSNQAKTVRTATTQLTFS